MKKLFIFTVIGMLCYVTTYAETFEWTSGQLGGGWYTMTAGLAKFIEEAHPDIKIKVVPGGGTANPSKVNKGKSQFGLGLDVLAFLAVKGTDIYKGKPHTELMMIGGRPLVGSGACTGCGLCEQVCPVRPRAIAVIPERHLVPGLRVPKGEVPGG